MWTLEVCTATSCSTKKKKKPLEQHSHPFKYHTVRCVNFQETCFMFPEVWFIRTERTWVVNFIPNYHGGMDYRLWWLVHIVNRVKIYDYRQSLEITAWAETWSQISTATNKDKWIQRKRLSICRGTLLLVTGSPADLLLLQAGHVLVIWNAPLDFLSWQRKFRGKQENLFQETPRHFEDVASSTELLNLKIKLS